LTSSTGTKIFFRFFFLVSFLLQNELFEKRLLAFFKKRLLKAFDI